MIINKLVNFVSTTFPNSCGSPVQRLIICLLHNSGEDDIFSEEEALEEEDEEEEEDCADTLARADADPHLQVTSNTCLTLLTAKRACI